MGTNPYLKPTHSEIPACVEEAVSWTIGKASSRPHDIIGSLGAYVPYIKNMYILL